MQQSPSLAEIFEAAIASHAARVWTALPARVESYDSATQTISAQPVVHDVFYDEYGERRTQRLPLCLDVPVCFPRGSGVSITWPLQVGDLVLLVFALGFRHHSTASTRAARDPGW